MRESFIAQNLKGCNRNLFLGTLSLFILLLLLAGIFFNYYYNLLCGPFQLSRTAAAGIKNPESRKQNYVTVTGVDVFDTGLQYLEHTYESGSKTIRSTKVKADYAYLVLFDKLLVVCTDPGKGQGLSFTGVIKPMPNDLRNALFEPEEDLTLSDFDEIVLPYFLDTQVSKLGGYAGFIAWLLLFIFIVWSLVKLMGRLSDRNRHPVYKALAPYGNPEAVAALIDEEIEQEGFAAIRRLVLTKGWLLWKRAFSLKVVPLEDVLWIYKNVTRQRVNYIPVGKTYSLRVHFKNQNFWAVGMKQKEVDRAVAAIGERAPNAIAGYSDQLKYMWEKDFSAFIDASQQKEA